MDFLPFFFCHFVSMLCSSWIVSEHLFGNEWNTHISWRRLNLLLVPCAKWNGHVKIQYGFTFTFVSHLCRVCFMIDAQA